MALLVYQLSAVLHLGLKLLLDPNDSRRGSGISGTNSGMSQDPSQSQTAEARRASRLSGYR